MDTKQSIYIVAGVSKQLFSSNKFEFSNLTSTSILGFVSNVLQSNTSVSVNVLKNVFVELSTQFSK